jgi:chromosome segregation ATPase
MTNPLDLPSRAVAGALDGLGSLGDAARRAPELQRELLSLLTSLDERLAGLPDALERTLRPHFDGQRSDIQALLPELERNRIAAESLPDHVDGLETGLGTRLDKLPAALDDVLRGRFDALEEAIGSLQPELVRTSAAVEGLPQRIDGLREELRQLRSEMAEIRAAVEPLQGPAERAARLSDRLPGSG